MIDIVINYCSIDFRFIETNIRECLKFSNNIIIPVCDHLFNGEPENDDILQQTYQLQTLSPSIKFLQYTWNENETAKYHHNLSRWIGYEKSTTPYILFLDADEIMDGDLTRQYFDSKSYDGMDVIAFKCYWYFREPTYRAKRTEMAATLRSERSCIHDLIFHPQERWAYRGYSGLRVREEETYDNKILCHHYSWVRTEKEMLKKVATWAHSTDKNWTSLVKEEFGREFNGTDFVHGYQYDILPSLESPLTKVS